MNVAVMALLLVLQGQVSPQDVDRLGTELLSPVLFLTGSGTVTSASPHGKPFPIPHFDLGGGVNLVYLKATNPSNGQTFDLLIPYPYLQAELGLTGGMSLLPMVGGLGALDLLVRWSPPLRYFGSYQVENPTGWGVGVKLGILRDRLIPPIPGVSLTYMHSSWGDLGLAFGTEGQSSYVYTRWRTTTDVLHLDISKNLLFFTPYAGIAWESGRLEGHFATVTRQNLAPTPGSPYRASYGRTYLGVILTPFPLLKAVGELSFYAGHISGSLALKVGI